MKALVTGSAGFLGRHFSTELKARGWTVSNSDILRGTNVRRVYSGDVYPGQVFDLVIHCAAQAPHRAAIDGDPTHLASNLLLDAGLFEWAVRSGQKRVLYISSSAAYPIGLQRAHLQPVKQIGSGLTVDYNTSCALFEDLIGRSGHLVEPDAGYGWLKLTGERMAADAARSGLPVHIVRPFSGYGEDQGEDWPFGAFAARARRREDPFVIWGDGTQVRDWLHVDDLVNGALAVVDADVREPVNLCTGVGTSMAELVQLFAKAAGYEPDVELRTEKPAGVAYRVGDPAKFHQIYQPKISIAEGVERALA